jgi:NADPH:quinone reductase-like Zn-dependent oxidoreductase
MKALKVQSPGHAAVVSDAKIPSLRPDYILIQTVAVALNPTDWKHLAMVSTPTTLGCDYAGVVLDVGSAVTKPFQKGDRVAGFVHGGNVVQEEDGAFGEYLVAKGDLQVKIPDGMSFEAAATLGVGIVTIGMGLYQSLGLPLPPAKAEFPVLIYGGSSAMGAYAIQWAKLCVQN